MDPTSNPFTPGAGAPPPELAGRDELLRTMNIALERIRLGRSAKSALLVGLRGVGKTVLLRRIHDEARKNGMHVVLLEAPEGRSLPALILPQLRISLLAMSRVEQAKALAERGLRAVAGFAGAFKMKYGDIEVGLDFEPEKGLADNGELEHDLGALLETVGLAARSAKTGFALFIDELQYVPERELAALISALHRCAQQSLPLTLVGAGLPQLRARTGEAKSYAERLFDFPVVGPLLPTASATAIVRPITEGGANMEPDALASILEKTGGYPYFLQEWGKHTWDAAEGPTITVSDVEAASLSAIEALDQSFFRVRLDRVSPKEKQYLRAMAELGQGPYRSRDIAQTLRRAVTSISTTRDQLINKGMIWSPSYGETAFTVPLFDAFMKRSMPGDDWRE